MPFYDFENKNTGEVKTIFFHMNDEKFYHGENGDEKDIWNRVFYAPNASMDTKADPFKEKDFLKTTENKKGQTMGDLWSRSAELSEKRKEKEGIDPVKEKFYDNYEKKNGVKHHIKKAEENSKKAKKISSEIMKNLRLTN